MRKTKIICTIGPACEDEKILKEMCLKGMNVARLNFSHGTHEEHKKKIELIKKVREELKLPIAIMLDTKGPEYRIGTFENGSIDLEDGDEFTLTVDDIVGNEKRVSVNYKRLMKNLTPGDTVLINNGLVSMEVVSVDETNALCKVITGGKLSNQKSMNFPGKVLDNEFLSEQDKSDILFGIENDVDFVAASFVSNRDDVQSLRDFLDENGGNDIEIIAKIENRSGVQNINEICKVTDGVMVARGDLGVEIPATEVPAVQKFLILTCRLLGKRVITATEMLESMIEKPRATRAEISDVANAVYDGTSAVMLSGETAAGKYPVQAVETMAKTAVETEKDINYEKRFHKTDFVIKSTLDAISHGACSMSIDVDAKCIAVNSLSGTTARFVSRFRAPAPIIGMTASEKGWRKLNLSWGVLPVLVENYGTMEEMFQSNVAFAREAFDLEEGDHIVCTAGEMKGKPGNTSMIKVETI